MEEFPPFLRTIVFHNHCWCKTVFVMSHSGLGIDKKHKECCVCGERFLDETQENV